MNANTDSHAVAAWEPAWSPARWRAEVANALYRMSQPPRGGQHHDDDWSPVRYVQHRQLCCRCFGRIERARPGSTTGTRGTKAWWHSGWDVWECLGCHEETTRAHLARLERDERRRQEAGARDGGHSDPKEDAA